MSTVYACVHEYSHFLNFLSSLSDGFLFSSLKPISIETLDFCVGRGPSTTIGTHVDFSWLKSRHSNTLLLPLCINLADFIKSPPNSRDTVVMDEQDL